MQKPIRPNQMIQFAQVPSGRSLCPVLSSLFLYGEKLPTAKEKKDKAKDKKKD